MIPKKIYYTWFGPKPLPNLEQSNIESWYKHAKGYDIIKLSEENFDVNKYPYTKWAYEHKIWSYVSDGARLDILSNQGGIYLDTDMALVAAPDNLLHYDGVLFQNRLWFNSVPFFGSENTKEFYRAILDELNEQAERGDVKDNILTVLNRNIHKMHSIRPMSKQMLPNGICVLDDTYFPSTGKMNRNGIGWHNERGSWLDSGFAIFDYLGFDIFVSGVFDCEKTEKLFGNGVKIGRLDVKDTGLDASILKYTNYFFNKDVIEVETENFVFRRYGDWEVRSIYQDKDARIGLC